MDELIIVNRPNQEPFLFAESQDHRWVVWGTCIRQLAIGFVATGLAGDGFRQDDLVFRGENAYRFCLEVVSGLHSPMFGETEVLGQFKGFFEDFVYPANLWGNQMKQFVQKILQDSKVIRQSCLKDLGSQTYGSVLRKRLKNERHVTFLGAGSLVESVLPWLVKEMDDIAITYRKKNERVDELSAKFPKITLSHWNKKMSDQHEVVVVAAPISAQEFAAWYQDQHGKIRVFIDLRETSETDPLGFGVLGAAPEVITLKGFFDEIQKTQALVSIKVEEAFRLAQELSALRADAMHVRPFGWEDLCV